MQGVITKGIGGFYYVKTEQGIIECRARGKFRKMNISPLVGDVARVSLTSEAEKTGSLDEILPRKNSFIRPPVANIDSFVITFSPKEPAPNLLLVDKLTLVAEKNGVECIICITKTDLAPIEAEKIAESYRLAGYTVLLTSSKDGIGIDMLKDVLKDKTSALAGNSGVGKSTILNALDEDFDLKTGDLSEKIKRGRHTTRHTELFPLKFGGFVLDTPGFSSFDLSVADILDVAGLFPEIEKHKDFCRFVGCSHITEPDCAVKEALLKGEISQSRYDSYKALKEELSH